MSLQTRVVLILDASSGDSIITTALQMQAGPQASLQARSVTGPALYRILIQILVSSGIPTAPPPEGTSPDGGCHSVGKMNPRWICLGNTDWLKS